MKRFVEVQIVALKRSPMSNFSQPMIRPPTLKNSYVLRKQKIVNYQNTTWIDKDFFRVEANEAR